MTIRHLLAFAASLRPRRCPLCDHRWHGLPCERSHDINGGPCPCPTAWKEPA